MRALLAGTALAPNFAHVLADSVHTLGMLSRCHALNLY